MIKNLKCIKYNKGFQFGFNVRHHQCRFIISAWHCFTVQSPAVQMSVPSLDSVGTVRFLLVYAVTADLKVTNAPNVMPPTHKFNKHLLSTLQLGQIVFNGVPYTVLAQL